MKDTAFCRGICAGMVLGVLLGVTVVSKRKAMKTCVGRTMQNMGSAVDCVLNDLKHAID